MTPDLISAGLLATIGSLGKAAGAAAGERLRDWIRGHKAAAVASKITDQVTGLRTVKTILRNDAPVDLMTFWDAPKVQRRGGKPQLVAGHASVPFDRLTVLVGAPGQGKSILLRYTSSAVCLAARIPLFLELRRLHETGSIHSLDPMKPTRPCYARCPSVTRHQACRGAASFTVDSARCAVSHPAWFIVLDTAHCRCPWSTLI